MRIHSRACMTCSQWGGGSFGDGGQADKSSFVAVLLLLSLLGNTLMLPLPTRQYSNAVRRYNSLVFNAPSAPFHLLTLAQIAFATTDN